jgi:exocyst complex component 2
MLALVGSGAADMASIAPLRQGDSAEVERLKALVGAARERCVTAVCAAWNTDAENIKFVEDWNRPPDRRDVTRMPTIFAAFEGSLLGGMQKILYVSEAMSKPGSEDIVLPPQQKLLQMVRSQYVTTLYKALSGMVENAERSIKKTDDEWTTDVDGYVATNGSESAKSSTVGEGTIDVGDRVRSHVPKTQVPFNAHFLAIECPHAADPEQPPITPRGSGPESQHQVRERLLCQAH